MCNFIVAVAILLMTSYPVGATTVLTMNFEELVRGADGVVLGTVEAIRAVRDRQGNNNTFVTLGELKVLTGRYEGERLVLQFEGGMIGTEVVEIVGSPQFLEQERVILFIRGNGEEIVPILGWDQGVFRIVRDPITGAEGISDAMGNRVFGIREGEVIKERRVGARVELFGAGRIGMAEVAKPEGGFGRTETGEEVLPEQETPPGLRPEVEMQAVTGVEGAMSLDQFVKAITEIARKHGVRGKPIRSVDPRQVIPPSEEDAVPRAVKVPEKTEPEPDERGTEPRRMEIDTEIDRDRPRPRP